MDNENETNCLTPEYLKDLLYSDIKIPLFTRNHFRECDHCQKNIIELNIENPVPKSSFGKEFSKVYTSWKKVPPSENEIKQEIFHNSSLVFDTKLFKFVYKHRLWIYIIGYASVIVAFSYFWIILLTK